MSKGTIYAIFLCGLLMVLITALGLSLAMSAWEVARSQHQWCDALNLLTRQPVARPANPEANPSRVEAYRLYEDFLTVRHEFGCR